MNQITIRKAADCFRTDEKTIVTFCNDFFSAPDFLNYLNNRGVSDGT